MQFVDDPIAYFVADGAAMHALSPAEAEPLQQQALAYRLTRLLPVIAPLAALAEAQGLSADPRTPAPPSRLPEPRVKPAPAPTKIPTMRPSTGQGHSERPLKRPAPLEWAIRQSAQKFREKFDRGDFFSRRSRETGERARATATSARRAKLHAPTLRSDIDERSLKPMVTPTGGANLRATHTFSTT